MSDPWTMDYPSGRKLDARRGPKNYLGSVSGLVRDDDEHVRRAKQFWPEAKAKDFTRDGRVWTDTTGARFKVAHGVPLLDLDPKSTGVACFVRADGFLVFLRREEDHNPAEGAERPKLPRRHWRILEPVEVARVLGAFTDEQARTAFLTLVLTGVRRSELQALRWRDVDLVEDVLRIRDSKSEDGVRSIAISAKLAEALWQHRRASRFQGDDERVFCHPERGTIYRAERFDREFKAALASAGITDYVRPFHDLRHTSITNDAAAGANPVALMTKAGHASMNTTKTYLHVAGVVFRDEADRLEARLLGETTTSDALVLASEQ